MSNIATSPISFDFNSNTVRAASDKPTAQKKSKKLNLVFANDWRKMRYTKDLSKSSRRYSPSSVWRFFYVCFDAIISMVGAEMQYKTPEMGSCNARTLKLESAPDRPYTGGFLKNFQGVEK